MFNLIVRPLLLLAGVITGWFVARDAANFTVVQGVVAMLLIAFFVWLAAYGPSMMRFLRDRRPPGDGRRR